MRYTDRGDVPVPLPRPGAAGRTSAPASAPASHLVLVERATYESLRALASEYGVSHGTIRTIVRTSQPQRAAAAAD